MIDNRKNPLWPWIVALLIGLPMSYVALFGAACGFVEHDVLPISVLDLRVFRPCLDLATDGPAPARSIILACVKGCGGTYALADAIARKDFDLAPYRGVTVHGAIHCLSVLAPEGRW